MEPSLLVQLLQPFIDWALEHSFAVAVSAAGLPVLLVVAYELLRGAPPRPEIPETARPAPPEVEEAAPAARPAEAAEPAAPPAPPEEQIAAPPALEAPVGPAPEAVAPPEPTPPAVAAPQPVPEPVPEVVPPAPPPPRPPRLGARLRRTREALVGRMSSVLGGRKVDAEVLDDIEALLFSADLGVKTADSLLEDLRSRAAGGDAGAVRQVLRQSLLAKLERVEPPPDGSLAVRGRPHVILILGVNGSGKTTTIGKLGARYAAAGKKVVFGAGDTFRAAAIDQLKAWGERVGCPVIAGREGGDPAAVAFDTVRAAAARGADVAIIDTAGRLQTKKPLMQELGKIARVLGREVEGAPHETLLVLDANTGQNAISQARLFTEAAGVTGLVLTKLDGTAKGGVLVGLADEFGIPVKYVGVGESAGDLRDFSAGEFVGALFEDAEEQGDRTTH